MHSPLRLLFKREKPEGLTMLSSPLQFTIQAGILLLGSPANHTSSFFIFYIFEYLWVSFIAQLVNNLPALQETPVQLLGQKDPLEKG